MNCVADTTVFGDTFAHGDQDQIYAELLNLYEIYYHFLTRVTGKYPNAHLRAFEVIIVPLVT